MTDDEAKRRTEVALENLRRIGVKPEEISKAAHARSALAGIGKMVELLPPATSQAAIDQAVLIERAFLALAQLGGALEAVDLVRPILLTFRRNLAKLHLTDYGRLKHVEIFVDHAHDPEKGAAALQEFLASVERLEQKGPSGSVN